MKLWTETITRDSYTKLITRKIDSRTGDVPGRDAGFQIGVTAEPDQDYDVTYYHDAYGRFQRVQGPGLPAYGVEYSYLANSDLPEYAYFKSGSSATVATGRR